MHDLQPFFPTFLLRMKHLNYWSWKFFALKLRQATSRCRQYLSVIPGKLSTHLSWGFWLSGLLSLQDNAKYLRTKPNKQTYPPILHSHISQDVKRYKNPQDWRRKGTHSTKKGYSEVLSNSGLPFPMWEGKIKHSLSTFMSLHLSRCWRHRFNHHSQCSHLIKPKCWPRHKTPALQTPLTALISATQCKHWNHQIQTPVPLWPWNTHSSLS